MAANTDFSRKSSLTVIVSFCVLLVAPALGYALGLGRENDASIRQTENREPARVPSGLGWGSVPSFTRELEKVIGDEFPFRRWLVEGYNTTKFFGFRDSTDPLVIRGRDGWLFLTVPDLALKSRALTSSDLAYIVNEFRMRAAWSASKGAHYVAVFVPDKSSIYPEELPYGRVLSHPTALERILPMLRNAGIDVFDTTPAIRRERGVGEVFLKVDSHWNERGAFAAYRALVRHLGLADEVAPLSFVERTTDGGDLIFLSGLPKVSTRLPARVNFKPRARATASSTYPGVKLSRVDDRRLPTAVVLSDSFGEALRPFLAEDFQRAAFVSKAGGWGFDKGTVLRERPQFVIQILVERSLREGFAHTP